MSKPVQRRKLSQDRWETRKEVSYSAPSAASPLVKYVPVNREYIYSNTLTLFILICLHTKQIPSWHEEKHTFKEGRAICHSVIWIYEGESHHLSWIKSPSAFEENPSPIASQTTLSTTLVLEVHTVFWCVHMTTVSLSIVSPTAYILAYELECDPLLQNHQPPHTSFYGSSCEWPVYFLHPLQILFLKCLIWNQ